MTPCDCLKRGRLWQVLKNRRQLNYLYDGSMSHQKDCYGLGVVSYSSDPSGDRVSPQGDVLEETLSLRRRTCHTATTSTTAKAGHN